MTSGDSFISELVGRAVMMEVDHQIKLGAMGDLIMLHYAEQSARLRARRNGGAQVDAYDLGLNMLNVQAAAAYQLIAEEAVLLPTPSAVDWDSLALAVIERKGPV